MGTISICSWKKHESESDNLLLDNNNNESHRHVFKHFKRQKMD